MLTERTGGISIVGRDEDVTTGEEKDRGDRVGKSGLLDSGVCLGSQSSVRSMGKKRWEVHPRVATMDGRVSGDEEREVRVAVDVKEEELISCDE